MKEKHERIYAEIDSDIKHRFKLYAVKVRRPINVVIEDAIRAYLKQVGG